MRKNIDVPPPADFASFSPSELFKYYFQIGRWTEESFSDALQAFTRGKLVSTVTISKWKNKNVIPTRYSGAFLKMVETSVGPELAARWTIAFETVWALRSSGRTQGKPLTAASNLSDAICARHREWITQLYFAKHPGEKFSSSDIYVPLQLCETGTEGLGPQDVEDIIERLDETNAKRSDWVFISGGPGSGKSMAALHAAHELCEGDVLPLYMRGNRLSNIDMDITEPAQPIGDSFSVKSFLKHFRASSFNSACLILDGVDEISQRPHGATKALIQFIAELENEQKACAAHDKKLFIIALGRDAHVQFFANQIFEGRSRRFTLCTLDGRARGQGDIPNFVQGQDLRGLWWEKYLAANGHDRDPSLPDFLSTEYDDFAELGGDPMLALLICHAALENQLNPTEKLPHEQVNALTHAGHKNNMYKNMFERQARSVQPQLDRQTFISAVQHIALALWQKGEGRSVSLEAIYDCAQDAETRASLRALGLSNSPHSSLPDLLVAVFYSQFSEDGQEANQNLIKFTHEAFTEYLVSTLLFDRFAELISSIGETAAFERALKGWVGASKMGAHGPILADFCQKEAAVRFDALSNVDWDAALIIISNHFHAFHFESSGLALMSEIQRSSSLLFFMWSCLNLERQKRTGKQFDLPNAGPGFSVSNLKNIQPINGLNFETGSVIEPTLRGLTFLTHTLSALHLKFADMSQLSFSIGHIENLICEETSFAMTHWSHVKISTANFTRTLFQQAIFHHWRTEDTHFTNCLFQGSRFQGGRFSNCKIEETFFSQCHFSDVEFIASQFKNVIFDRCVFSQSVFSRDKGSDAPLGAQFRHCTFIDMEASLKNIPAENISNAIFESKTKNDDIETALNELL